MQHLPRQVVACLTAAFVLFFNVYCACGGHSSGGDSPAGRCHAHDAKAAPPKPHCVTHHCAAKATGQDLAPHPGCHGGGNDGGPSEPIPGSHGHGGGGGGCQHCQPTGTTVGEVQRLDDFTPYSSAAACPPSSSVDPAQQDHPALQPARFGDDLPAPTAGPTLLSLHCALNS